MRSDKNDSILRLWSMLIVMMPSLMVCDLVQAEPDNRVDYENDIVPIFDSYCFHCHGEDEQESNFRVDQRATMLSGGDYGLPAIVPGHADQSFLMDLITHQEAGLEMPPEEDKLPDEEIDLIRRWIDQGAVVPGQMDQPIGDPSTAETHWAYQPLQTEFDHAAIDGFIDSRLSDAGLTRSQTAEPRHLIRRLSIVLTGLAATPEQTKQFVDAFYADPDGAYKSAIDHFLDSPHFGERWAQHWLDVIRWAETNGSESNLYRKNAWSYRDYVVDALNDDIPYDQFIREQIAGDTMNRGEATGFLVAGPHVPAATVGQEPSAIRQARADRMDEILQTVGASVMGMTVGCARCHNHKFDPLTITDYYAMSDVFQGIEFGSRYPELADDHPRKVAATQIRSQLEEKRDRLRDEGGWIEDWMGYTEVHFKSPPTNHIRIEFQQPAVRIDELEVFSSDDEINLLAANDRNQVTITANPETAQPRGELKNINDGNFGTQAWFARGNMKQNVLPWLEIKWDQPVSLSRIRLSKNREDFFGTDYLLGLDTKLNWQFIVRMQDTDGSWKSIASTKWMKSLAQKDSERAKTLNEIDGLAQRLIREGPQPSFVGRMVEPAESFVLSRGSPESPRNRVFASAPQFLDGQLEVEPNAQGAKRRLAFARWLTDPSNPLTSRVAANRIWHNLFGAGIVVTPSDFGRAGAAPTHPELLDFLARRLLDSDWSTRSLIREILLSQTFRQSSQPSDLGMQLDGSCSLLWRFPPRRVEAEVIRDSILQAAGTLDASIGGPSYRIHNVKKRYSQWQVTNNYAEPTWRRMLYQERMRRVDDRIFTAFDFPDCGQIRAKRPVSTTPLQALNLFNSEFVVTQSRQLADRVRERVGDDIAAQVDASFNRLLCRVPSRGEQQFGMQLVQQNGLEQLVRALINSNEFAFLP